MDHNFSDGDEDENEDFIAEVMTYPAEYIHCDDDLVCFGSLSDEEILQSLNDEDSTRQNDDLNLNEDELFTFEKDPPTTKDILNSVDILRSFCLENDIESSFLFEKIEERALKHSIKKSQTKITDFFQ